MLHRSLLLSLLASTLLFAEDTKFDDLKVVGSINSMTVTDISSEELKSADLAEALTKNVPSITLVRRSGIANDIILRGQKKDNINILIDDAKIYGACPNRMDPATSHVLSNNVDSVEVVEGPFDSENFGTLSGAVKIHTKKPAEEVHGEFNANFGDFGYMKGSATVSGGNQKLKVLLSGSTETSNQYLDGNGDNFAQQIIRLNPTTMASMNPRYQDAYANMNAFKKSTFMGKLYYDISNNQELKLSYTLNRSEHILYPSSAMDALYDNSDLFNASYTLHDLGAASKELSIDYYNSFVDHPMANYYRVSDLNTSKESALTAGIQGLKVKNIADLGSTTELTYGLDASNRKWDGIYKKNYVTMALKSIDNANTLNSAVFTSLKQKYGSSDLKAGLRYDYTMVTTDRATQQNREFQALNAYIDSTFHASDRLDYFIGLGRSSRVPDARELYFVDMSGAVIGNNALNQTVNNELDLAVEKSYQSATIKAKLFYSYLQDFISYHSTNKTFENIDATVYGLSLNGSINLTETLSTNYGLAFQRGQKRQALTGQTDLNLPEIPPLKANLSLVFEPNTSHKLKAEVIAADAWQYFDADNGEQALNAYALFNLKYLYTFARKYGVTLGVDNVFNTVYNTTNTYKDLTLLANQTGAVMLINEPGRYAYINLSYKY